jgi:DNA (cytosine-5)-methyltransferase 1
MCSGDGLRIGSLFSGVGGLDLAVEAWTGGTTAWHCEVEPAAAAVLAARWPGVPNLGDITQVDWTAVAPVDVLTGGFPCQDVSGAGLRQGLRPGTRSGLWQYMAAAVDVLRPEMVVIENVRGILSAEAHCDLERDCWCVGDAGEPALRALGAVLGDLSELGYDAAWGTVPASWAGAPHRRERVFVVAADRDRGLLDGRLAEGQGGRAEPADRGGGDALTLLPTPKTRDHKDGALGVDNRNRVDDTDSVPRAVRHLLEGGFLGDPLLPTPKASDGAHGGPGMRNSRGGIDALPAVAALLPTPQAHDAHGPKTPEQVERGSMTGFGPYTEAVQRWEAVLGRPAPPPAVPNKDGKPRLNPVFVEWMMGLPEGFATGTGISRTSQLKALGNGVVPQQAVLALDLLVPELLREPQP